MGLNLLAQISAAKPVIFAEGLFISCYLQNEKFVPEQGIDKSDIISILNGEFFKSGTDFVEDFTLKRKLHTLPNRKDEYELEQFPVEVPERFILSPEDLALLKDTQEYKNDGIAMLHISAIKDNEYNKSSSYLNDLRKLFEKQVIWTMEEGDDFVNTEVFTELHEALILLDVLKKYDVPSVVSFLAKRNEPIAITYSKIQISLDSLLFCLFQ
ncbi:uncharacterized protein LOC135692881 isoform X2 [Rhopilema esculentum]